MRRWCLVLLLALSLSLLGMGMAVAQDSGTDSSPKVQVEVKPGYHVIGHNDEMNKVGEYESLSSGAQAEINGKLNVGVFNADVHAFYYDEDEKEWSAYFDVGRVLRLDYSYDSFLHRLQHDYLYKDEPRFPKNIPPNGVNNGLVAFNPFWVYSGGALSLEGAQMVAADDLDVGRDYQIMRSENKAVVKMQLPFFPYIIPEVRVSQESKRGWRQVTVLQGKCTPCHIVGVGRRVNENTRTVTAGFTAKYGIVTASYFHTWRHFDNRSGTPTRLFDGVYAPPTLTPIFQDRLLYEGDVGPYAEVPDSSKHTDKVKVRVDLPYHSTLYASYVTSNVENNYTNKDYGIDAFAGRFTTTLLDNRLTVTLKGRYYSIDNDDVYVNVASISNNATFYPTDPAYTMPISAFNYTRKSDLDRDVTELGVDFRFKLMKGYTLRAGYEYQRIDRDNKKWKDYSDWATDLYNIQDEEFLKDRVTNVHKVKLSLLGRPLNTLNFRLTYQFQYKSDAFQNHNGICLDDRFLPAPGGIPYYEIFRNVYRTRDATNVPDRVHDIKLVATWSPLPRYSTTVNLQYKYQKNRDSDWKGQVYMAGVNFWLSPLNNLVFNLGASYEYDKYETRFDLNLFGG